MTTLPTPSPRPARRTVGAVASVALTAGLVLTGGTAAQAQQRHVSDPEGDCLHGAGLLGGRVAHTEDQVVVRTSHVNLRRSPATGSSLTVWLDTDASTAGPDVALVGGLYEGSDYRLVRTDGWRIPRDADAVRGTYRLQVRYGKDKAVVTIANATLGDPAEVRFAAESGGERTDGSTVHDWLGGRRHLSRWAAEG